MKKILSLLLTLCLLLGVLPSQALAYVGGHYIAWQYKCADEHEQ